MTNFIPIFPLNIVVYPGEHLNLHIFEPRYKQLISECSEAGKPFGIPTVLENKMNDMGTLVESTLEVQQELVFYWFFIFLFYYHYPRSTDSP